MSTTMSATQTALRLQRINQKGWETAQRLAAVKARQDVELSDLDGLRQDDLKEPPEVRLRRFLDLINAARARLGSDQYGLCVDCGAPFGDAQLDELPWVARCARCDAL